MRQGSDNKRRRGRPQLEQPTRAAINQRRYRLRLRQGKQVYSIALGSEVLEGMARLRWLSWDDLDHKDRVERAIEEGLADALKNLLFHNNPINAHFIRVSCRSTAPPANLRLKPKEAFSGGGS